MFELNLIKDKAKARQRRRIIFLSIVGILFLSGLLSIFVFFALFWRETITLKNAQDEVARVDKSLKELKDNLDKREPAARKRRPKVCFKSCTRTCGSPTRTRAAFHAELPIAWIARPRKANT